MKKLMNEIKEYLEDEYLSLQKLAKRTSVDEDRIFELEETQCIPGHSYSYSRTESVNCSLKGTYTEGTQYTRYYNPSIERWVKEAEELAEQSPLTEVANKVRSKFNEDFKRAFGDKKTPGCKGLDHAWRYFINGTWGVCLKDISIDYIANKELSRLKISNLVDMGDESHQLNDAETEELRSAVDNYEKATKKFSPQLIPVCSRTCEVEPAVKKYLIE